MIIMKAFSQCDKEKVNQVIYNIIIQATHFFNNITNSQDILCVQRHFLQCSHFFSLKYDTNGLGYF